VAWLTALVGRAVMKVDFLGIVNVIAGREVVRELLQEQATGSHIAEELERLLGDPAARQTLQADLAKVTQSLGGGGAHERAAEAVLNAI
jgi:lipid-A-disaccharide synthase